jgi:hypothetical protein
VAQQLFIFISYGEPDRDAARALYGHLSIGTAIVWFDKITLLPGQRWQDEISRAIRKADFVVLLLSSRTVNRRGYFHREMSLALEILQQVPPDQIYLLPARLDDCDVPESIRHIHWVDLFPDWQAGIQQLERALNTVKPVNAKLPSRVDKPLTPPLAEKKDKALSPTASDRIDPSYEAIRWFGKFRTDILAALLADLALHIDHGLAPKEANLIADAFATSAAIWSQMPQGSFLQGGAYMMIRFYELFLSWASANSPDQRQKILLLLRRQRAKLSRWSRNNQLIVASTLDYEAVSRIIHGFREPAECPAVFPNLARTFPQ